jgi:hypothetical protein
VTAALLQRSTQISAQLAGKIVAALKKGGALDKVRRRIKWVHRWWWCGSLQAVFEQSGPSCNELPPCLPCPDPEPCPLQKGQLQVEPRSSASPWRRLVQPVVGNMSLAGDESHLSELLNVAYARHELVSDHLDAALSWLEAGGKKSIESLL